MCREDGIKEFIPGKTPVPRYICTAANLLLMDKCIDMFCLWIIICSSIMR